MSWPFEIEITTSDLVAGNHLPAAYLQCDPLPKLDT